MKALLPRMVALEALSALLPDRKLAAQVLDYWLKKRAEEGGPLLARLWFEQPWKVCVINSMQQSNKPSAQLTPSTCMHLCCPARTSMQRQAECPTLCSL